MIATDAAGIQLDVIPSIRLQEEWQSNVFDTSTNEVSSFGTRLTPGLAFKFTSVDNVMLQVSGNYEKVWYYNTEAKERGLRHLVFPDRLDRWLEVDADLLRAARRCIMSTPATPTEGPSWCLPETRSFLRSRSPITGTRSHRTSGGGGIRLPRDAQPDHRDFREIQRTTFSRR